MESFSDRTGVFLGEDWSFVRKGLALLSHWLKNKYDSDWYNYKREDIESLIRIEEVDDDVGI